MECVDLSIMDMSVPSIQTVALRMECVDLSIALNRKNKLLLGRTPHGVRGFKLAIYMYLYHTLFVALRMECVDLSLFCNLLVPDNHVALRMECVDLSLKNPLMSQSSTVALRMECVDLSVKAELVKGGLITIIPHTKCLESTENLLRKGAGK